MQPVATFCLRCGTPHAHHSARNKARGSDGWVAAEDVRRGLDGQLFPHECLAPLRYGDVHAFNVYTKKTISGESIMPKRRDGTLHLSWDGYYAWLWEKSKSVGEKGKIAVTNLTASSSRRARALGSSAAHASPTTAASSRSW